MESLCTICDQKEHRSRLQFQSQLTINKSASVYTVEQELDILNDIGKADSKPDVNKFIGHLPFPANSAVIQLHALTNRRETQWIIYGVQLAQVPLSWYTIGYTLFLTIEVEKKRQGDAYAGILAESLAVIHVNWDCVLRRIRRRYFQETAPLDVRFLTFSFARSGRLGATRNDSSSIRRPIAPSCYKLCRSIWQTTTFGPRPLDLQCVS